MRENVFTEEQRDALQEIPTWRWGRRPRASRIC